MWSAIVPRLLWRASCALRLIDKARKGVNKEVGRAIRQDLVPVISHLNIRVSMPELYRPDRVHLFDRGLDVFLEDLQGGLRAEIFGLVVGKGYTL